MDNLHRKILSVGFGCFISAASYGTIPHWIFGGTFGGGSFPPPASYYGGPFPPSAPYYGGSFPPPASYYGGPFPPPAPYYGGPLRPSVPQRTSEQKFTPKEDARLCALVDQYGTKNWK